MFDPIAYWNRRAKEQGHKAVGYFGLTDSENDKQYQERFDLITPHLPTEKTVLDYGCGVGMYAQFFHPDRYIGVDISEEMVKMARERNPLHTFLVLPDELPETDVVFTATVLQHNDDEAVKKIVAKFKAPTLIIYENTANYPDKDYMHFRTVEDYERLFGRKCSARYSHTLIEEHTLMIYE